MAVISGDPALAFEVCFVDVHLHFHHVASELLFIFVVFFGSVLNVAKLAFDAERGADELHNGNQLIGRDIFQNLDVLEFLGGRLRSRRRRVLRACSKESCKDCNESKEHRHHETQILTHNALLIEMKKVQQKRRERREMRFGVMKDQELISPRPARSVMRSAARNASASMVSVGWPRPEVTKLLPSQMKRFLTSCV